MQSSRRGFLLGAAGAAAAPALGWAEAGSPWALAAGRAADGGYALHGLSAAGRSLFALPLPGRGHAAAAHPLRPLAVAFARRPGTFALVIDCVSGRVLRRLAAPEGRHFYGHGAFSADGTLLFTPENDFEAGEGRIGVWAGFERIAELPSGGVGPHDMQPLPGGGAGSGGFVIANGGIMTHPDSGRAKLNLPFMAPNLAWTDGYGRLEAITELPPRMRLSSIRHLAVRADGLVAFAMQRQDDAHDLPLLGLVRRGAAPVLVAAPGAEARRSLAGYGGSVAFSGDGRRVAVSAPRGGRIHVFDAADGAFLSVVEDRDVCGLAPGPGGGFMTSSGAGLLAFPGEAAAAVQHDLAWDNHLVRVGAA